MNTKNIFLIFTINVYHDNSHKMCVNKFESGQDTNKCYSDEIYKYDNASIFAPPDVATSPNYAGLVIIGPP